MQLQNTLSSINLNYDINLNNKKENKLTNSTQESTTKTNEILLDIKNITNSRTSSLLLPNNLVDKKLDILNSIKDALKNFSQIDILEQDKPSVTNIRIVEEKNLSISDFNKYINNIPNSVKQEELNRARELLNPNQKFHTQEDKNKYLSKMDSLKINVALLPEEERRQYFTSAGKALSNDFDKKNDFDSSINNVYFAQKSLESTRSLTNKNTINKQIEILDKINDKLLLASKDSTTLKEKKNLVNEIKDLLKNIDKDSSPELKKEIISLSDNLDEVINNQNAELKELSTSNLNITSFVEAKSYLEKMQKLDINFDDLSNSDKKTYLKNKQKVIESLKSQEATTGQTNDTSSNKKDIRSYSKLNDELNSTLIKILKTENDEIEELTNFNSSLTTASEAKDFLDTSERRKSSINNMSETDKKTNSIREVLAKQLIESDKKNSITNQIDAFVQNIDNLIEVLNNSRNNLDFNLNLQNISNDHLNFKSQDISNTSGSFKISQSSNINPSNIFRLISWLSKLTLSPKPRKAKLLVLKTSSDLNT